MDRVIVSEAILGGTEIKVNEARHSCRIFGIMKFSEKPVQGHSAGCECGIDEGDREGRTDRRRWTSVRGARESGDPGGEDILSVSSEEDGVPWGGGGALVRVRDFHRESARCFGGIPGVVQICLSCFRTYAPSVLKYRNIIHS